MSELAEFKARNNITVTTYDSQLTPLITKLRSALDRLVGAIFTLSTKTKKYSGDSGGVFYLPIGVWQATNLTFKRGCFGSDTLTDLVIDKDLEIVSVNDQDQIIYGIRLFARHLTSQEFIEVSGTYGWSDGLPDDLLLLLDDAILTALNYRLRLQGDLISGGQRVESERSGNLSTKFVTGISNQSNPDEIGRKLNSGNLLAVSEIADLISYYQTFITKQFLTT